MPATALNKAECVVPGKEGATGDPRPLERSPFPRDRARAGEAKSAFAEAVSTKAATTSIWVEEVKQLKREKRYAEAERFLVGRVRLAERLGADEQSVR